VMSGAVGKTALLVLVAVLSWLAVMDG